MASDSSVGIGAKPITFDDVKGMGRDEGLITGLQSIKRILGEISEKGKNFHT